MRSLRVLVIPSWYRLPHQPTRGVFFLTHAAAISRAGNSVSISYVDVLGVRSFLHWLRSPKVKDTAARSVSVRESVRYTIALPFLSSLNQKIRLRRWKRLIARHIAVHGRPHVVQLHSFYSVDVAMWVSKEYDVPFVLCEHSTAFERGILSDAQRMLAVRAFRRASAVVAVSRSLQHTLENDYSVRAVVIPNPVDTDFFALKPPRIKPLPSGVWRIITVGALVPKKNQRLLLECARVLVTRGRSIDVTIVGDGPLRSELQRTIQTYGLCDCVSIRGPASPEEIRHALQQSDVFVLTSKVETFGVVLIEALSTGLPVVATRCGGPEDIVTNPTVGKLCDHDAAQIADGIEAMMTSPPSPEDVREHSTAMYSLQSVGIQFARLYNRVLFPGEPHDSDPSRLS